MNVREIVWNEREKRDRETEWDVKVEKAAGREGCKGGRADMDVRVIKRPRMGIWTKGK